MELAPVFLHAHARIFAMLAAGEIEGLRIDHIDGLFDPKTYLAALRERAERPFYLVVEKILGPHEFLRADWPVDGGTGYDFVNLVRRLSRPRNRHPLALARMARAAASRRADRGLSGSTPRRLRFAWQAPGPSVGVYLDDHSYR